MHGIMVTNRTDYFYVGPGFLWPLGIPRKQMGSPLGPERHADRIMYLGMRYIDRGWITQDEYENLNTYLYEPYKKLGGNGSALRVMQEVNKLPIRNQCFEGMGGK